MLAMPDPDTAFVDPFMAEPTLSLTCTIAETGTLEPYVRDPRGIAQRAEKYLASTGLADSAVFGPEAEFFIFDNVQFDRSEEHTSELQSRQYLVCRLLLEKKNRKIADACCRIHLTSQS